VRVWTYIDVADAAQKLGGIGCQAAWENFWSKRDALRSERHQWLEHLHGSVANAGDGDLPLTARARYLFEQTGIDPAAPPLQILARKGRALRDLIRCWWTALEPEATAGVVAPRMEEALVAFAAEALKEKGSRLRTEVGLVAFRLEAGCVAVESGTGYRRTVSRRDGSTRCAAHAARLAPRVHARRSARALSRLGYLAFGKWPARCWPEIDRRGTAGQPRRTRGRRAPRGHTMEEGRNALREVAKKNLYLAMGFLWDDAAARAEEGLSLASEILGDSGDNQTATASSSRPR
jgi:hypothetical protein